MAMVMLLLITTAEGFLLVRYENVGAVGDHGGVGSDHVGQVTGEGSREVVGLERLCREGRAGQKVRFDFKYCFGFYFEYCLAFAEFDKVKIILKQMQKLYPAASFS